MKVTIKTIAKLAGVSTATVSKVVNGKDENITEDTRNRVLKVIEENNYVPNRVASSMVTKKTKTIGLVIPDIANPFFPELARGVEDRAKAKGYNVIFCNTDNDLEKEEGYIAMLQEKMVDGIILTSSSRRKNASKSLLKLQIPVITVDRNIEGLKTQGIVSVDNEIGAFDAVKYMIDRGYKKILHITGPITSKPTSERLKGYMRALESEDIAYDEKLMFEGEFTSDWGYKSINEAIKEHIEFDGIFCGNDLIAMGVIKELKNHKLKVPDDIGVVGFDDIYMAVMIEPELTTVRQPTYKMGYKAAELLINTLENIKIDKNDYLLKTKLIIRNSTI